jgi:hypothetical protein
MQITRLRQFWALPTATQRLLRPRTRGRATVPWPVFSSSTSPDAAPPAKSDPVLWAVSVATHASPRGSASGNQTISSLRSLANEHKPERAGPRCLPRVRGHAASRLAGTTSVVSTLALCRLFARNRCNTARGPRLRQRTATSGAPGQQASRRWPLPTPGSAPTSPRAG